MVVSINNSRMEGSKNQVVSGIRNIEEEYLILV